MNRATINVSREDLQHYLTTDHSEVVLGLADGQQIAIKQWGPEFAPVRILALHGWGDNANTWNTLAPLLISTKEADIRLVAIDFAGHGYSMHRHNPRQYTVLDHAFDVTLVADALRWKTFVLLGHSMGGAVATIVAAAAPERVKGLILVDNCGIFNSANSSFTEAIRRSIRQYPQLLRRRARTYTSYQQLLDKHKQNDRWGLSEQATSLLVERGHRVVELSGRDSSSQDKKKPADDSTSERDTESEYMFSHDPRIVIHTPYFISEEEVQRMFSEIRCPAIIFFNGTEQKDAFEQRWKRLRDHKIVVLDACHHLHLEYPDKIFKDVLTFVREKTLNFAAKL